MRIYRRYLIYCQLHVDVRKFFQHDNARPHVSVKTKTCIKKNRINVLPWPANSLDINIIENVWSIMDDKLLKHSIYNTEQLKNAMIKIWNEISIEMIKKNYIYQYQID